MIGWLDRPVGMWGPVSRLTRRESINQMTNVQNSIGAARLAGAGKINKGVGETASVDRQSVSRSDVEHEGVAIECLSASGASARQRNWIRDRIAGEGLASVRHWVSLIAVTGSAQIAVQAIGFVCGILVLRFLSLEEYALYTLVNTMLGTMTVLADAGVSAGVMAQGGKVWGDKKRLGAVLVTGMSLRKRFAAFSLLAVVPFMFFLLNKNGVSWIPSTILVLSLIPVFFTALSGSLLQVPAKLHQSITPIQRLQVSSNALRLAMTGASLFFFPFAAVAILATGISQAYLNRGLWRISDVHADSSQSEDPLVRSDLIRSVRRIFPSSLYYCFSSQITIWVVCLIGTTESLANVGALSRISVIFSVGVTLFGTLLVPRFARMHGDSGQVRKAFCWIVSLFLLLSVLFNVVAWCFPAPFLLILGDRYSQLDILLRWSLAGASLGAMNMVLSQLMNGRGVIPRPTVLVPLSFIVQVGGLLSQDLQTLEGVFAAGIISNGSLVLFRCAYFFLAESRSSDIVREASSI